ncbi:MAG: DMT family transporter [Clostridia bacterium]|nr:DMT family transporter [Clostridia bacterium]
MDTTASKKIGIIQMVLCAVLWSIGGVFIKAVEMNAFVIAGGRSLFAVLAVIVYMALTKQKFILSRDTLVSGGLLSMVFICFVAANKYTTAANAIVLQYTAPIFVLIFTMIFLHKKPRYLDIAAVLLTLVGVVVFFLGSLEAGGMLGNALGVLAGMFMGGMFVAVGNTKGEEKMSGILLGHLFCAAIGLPFLAFTENTVNAKGVFFLVLLGVVQLGIPYILYALATNRCSAISCVVISAIEPILNPIWVAIFNKEIPSALSMISGLFLIAVITVYSVLDERMAKKQA